MANVIDILVRAIWQGDQSVKKASTDLRAMGDNAASTSAEMEAVAQQTAIASAKLTELFESMESGEITAEEMQRQWNEFADTLPKVTEAADEVTTAVTNTAEAVSEVGEVTPGTIDNIKKFRKELLVFGAAMAGSVILAKKFYRVLKEGAAIQLVTQRFDRLAASIGTTGEALERDLRIATRGTVTDIELAATATDLMAQGLANSHDEAVQLTSIMNRLGVSSRQLATTITDKTTAGFDALGLSADGFEDKVRKLEDAGYDADKAFDMAFVEQAEEQIRRVGSAAGTTADDITKIETAWTNSLNAIKESAIESAGPAVTTLASAVTPANEVQAALQDVARAAEDIGKQEEAVRSVEKALIDLDSASLFAIGLQSSFEEGHDALIETAVLIAKTGETLDDQKAILESFGFTITKTQGRLGGFHFQWTELEDALEENKLAEIALEAADADKAMTQLGTITDDAAKSFKSLRDETGEWTDEAQDAINAANEFGLALGDFGSLEGANFAGIAAAAGASIDKVLDDAKSDRVDVWLEFQEDLTNISVREAERREELEGDFEKRRTDILAKYGAQRTQQEEDFLRRRARAEAKLQSDIDSTQEDSAEKQIEIRERNNERLADLERDHLSRMQDIIDNAELQLIEAAGRLDASAVTAIQQQKKKALEQEAKDHQENQDELARQLEQQLAAEREASAERIAEQRKYNDDRKKIEDEDRAIRLQRQRDAHNDRMALLDTQETERLDELKANAEKERTTANDNYADLWDDRKDLDEEKQAEILKAEAAWWDQRLGLIPAGGPNATNLPTETGGFPYAVGPNAGQLPQSLLEQSSVNTGDITINVSGAGDPEATGLSVRDELLQLFTGGRIGGR